MRIQLPNLYFSQDESEIIDLLVDCQQMPSFFDKDLVISFMNEENYFLILFFASQDDRGFQLFMVENFAINDETMFLLADSIELYIKEGFNPKVLTIAKNKVLDLAYMTPTFRAFFGKDKG